MVFNTFPDGQPGTYDVDAYKGSPADAATFGVQRLKDLETDEVLHFHTLTQTFISVGYRMSRKGGEQDEGTGNYVSFGEWMPLHAQNEDPADPGSRYVKKHIAKPDKEVQAAPGANMKTPYGVQLFEPDGSPIKQPASGEQARNKYTGALLFEADGTTPIRVP